MSPVGAGQIVDHAMREYLMGVYIVELMSRLTIGFPASIEDLLDKPKRSKYQPLIGGMLVLGF